MKFNALPILLAGTFLSSSAVAQTVPTINTDYLNSLTGEKVTWEDASASDEGAIEVVGKYYKATYHNIDNYEEIKDKSENISVVDPTDQYTYKYVGVGIHNPASNNYGDVDKKLFLNNEITANIEGFVDYLYVYGGVISNQGKIGDIIADFVGNSIEVTKSGNNNGTNAYGGAISNCDNNSDLTTTIGDITGNFIGNYVSADNQVKGGAIYNESHIGNIEGDFIGNHANATLIEAFGGAIYNYYGSIGNIIGDFIGNYTTSSRTATAGAIFNNGSIGDITGDFIANYASGSTSSSGAIANSGTIGNITGDFIGNYASGSGGAISNSTHSSIGTITGDFIGNHASGTNAYGGAISNYYNRANTPYTIGNIAGNFIGNYAKSTSENSLGGAVCTDRYMSFSSSSDPHFFTGNYTEDSRGKIYNAIYGGASATIAFDTSGGGAWVINDNIENGKYNFIGNDTIDTELGTTTQYINMNNAIVNAGQVNVENTTLRFGNYQHEDTTAKNWNGKGKFIASLNSDGTENLDADSVTSLTLNNAVFDISNGYMETVKLKNYSATDSFVHLDVDVENMTSDVINVKGDVDGITKLVIHATSDKDIRGQGQILFAESFGDTLGDENSFEVARVYKSPFMYDVVYSGVENTTTTTESKDNKWSLEMNGVDNPNKEQAPVDPNPDVPNPEIPDINIPDNNINRVSTPEIVAGIGLHTAGIEQTRTVVRNVSGKVANARSYCPNCGIVSDAWDGKQLNNGWVLAQGEYSNIDKPVDMEAKIWGVEGGFDLQSDMNNTFGIFASYRNGEYDLSGKGARYRSDIGSKIEIDSYLAGLYYRYDKNMNWLFATVYGGTQDAEAKTDDGIASFETDGLEFGASAEIGHSFALSKNTTLSPSLGVYYTQINYDEANDNVGKKYKWDDIKHLEAELGLSLAKNFENGKVYVKPSVIQTLTDDDEVSITGLSEVDTIEDETLGRIEIGGNYGFNDNWSAYGWANYTFGSDYEATSLGAGVNYAW